MGSTDLTHYGATSSISVTSGQAYEGDKSLKFQAGNSDKMGIHDKTETDAPAVGIVYSWVYWQDDGGSNRCGCFFRFQDTGNLYMIQHDPTFANQSLYRIKGGNFTKPDETSVDSTPTKGSWTRCRYQCWENSGAVNFRVEYYDGSSWIQAAPDCSDPANEFAGGGGMGYGDLVGSNTSSNDPYYIDNVEVWYYDG